MGTLYLVRHAQASLGAADYDQLSELGRRQSIRLGEHFTQRGLQFDAVLTGTLRRHGQTLAGIRQGMGSAAEAWGDALLRPGLNEYDSAALIAAIHPQTAPAPDSPDSYRQHFRLLREGLRQWMAGQTQPVGMPDYPEFVAGVQDTLDEVKEHYAGCNVLLLSSGGPIATAIGQILGTPPETIVELNMRLRNSAISETTFNAKRHSLLSYNALPHLEQASFADWISYA